MTHHCRSLLCYLSARNSYDTSALTAELVIATLFWDPGICIQGLTVATLLCGDGIYDQTGLMHIVALVRMQFKVQGNPGHGLLCDMAQRTPQSVLAGLH